MKVKIVTLISAPCDVVYDAVRKTSTFFYITKNFVRFVPSGSLPLYWENKKYRMRLLLFGVLPFGKQTLGISVHLANRTIPDEGYGTFLKKWRHLIKVKGDHSKTLYMDQVEFKAGIFTIFFYPFVYGFYRYRQFRLKKWIARGDC